MRATTDFLLREALTLLLDDPSPRNVAQAMGGEYAKEEAVAAALLDSQSQTEGSEDSESQAAAVSTNTHRVMIVRSTNSAQQLVTLVDRAYSIEAFIATPLVEQLKEKHRYKSLSRLRGSVVRVEKYHFVTPSRCRALLKKEKGTMQSQSVATRLARGEQSTRLWLHVDGLSVIDDSELAVNPLPELEEHPEVAKRLHAMKPEALEQRLVLRQSLAPLTPTNEMDHHHPLLDEDCEIPEDQERELGAQEGWGEFAQEAPTDSQLIAENGPVTGTDSQQTSSGSLASSGGSTTVILSSEPQSQPQGIPRVIIPETESGSISQVDASVPDSQDYHFQRENLATAFKECPDTESEDEMDARSEHASQEPSGNDITVDPTGNEGTISSLMSGRSQMANESSQPPMTQAMDTPESLPTDSFSSESASDFHTESEFIGVVRDDHDEPMTQQAGESQANTLLALSSSSERRKSQADEQSGHYARPNGQKDTRKINLVRKIPEESEHDTEVVDRDDESEQDGQADYWMNTQPGDTHSAEAVASRTLSQLASTLAGSPQTGSQRRKRRLSPANTPSSEDTRQHSPQEPNTKAARSQRSLAPSTSQSSFRGIELPPSPEMFSSFTTQSSEPSGSQQPATSRAIFGISSFNKRSVGRQKARPSNRYHHLLPPFDLESITREIASKKH